MGSIPIGISGSRAAGILGLSPWATPFEVWQDIMEARTPGFNEAQKFDYVKFEGNVATRWGHAFEDAIIGLAVMKGYNGNHHITDQERVFSLEELPYVTCHIDGMYQFNPRVLHEGKTTTMFGFNEKWGEPGTDRIPIEYQIQAQHQMLCTGAKEVIVSVLVFPKRPDDFENDWIMPFEKNGSYFIALPEGETVPAKIWAAVLDQMGFFHQYTIKADPDLHAMMIEAYKEWWQNHVMGVIPPDPKTYTDIRAMITAPSGTIVADENMIRMFKEYEQIGSEIGKAGNLSKRRDQLKKMILDQARQMESTLDDESTDKWIFRDDRGGKLGQYGKTARGMMFK
jgi:hypothetical protein